jgi:hypothetical protein
VSVGRSATAIGREFGRNGREMNALLKDHGYLDGQPGAYELTEKGRHYGSVHFHDNGYGGYAARAWETLTWSAETAAALRADIDAIPAGSSSQAVHSTEVVVEAASDLKRPAVSGHADRVAEGAGLTWKVLAVAGIVVAGVILVAPHAKAAWNDKVKPYAQKTGLLRARSRQVENRAFAADDQHW